MSTQIAPISELLPYILPTVPACPRPFAEFKAREAVIEFCERTMCWRQILTVNLTANNRALIAPPFATIHEFEEVTLNGRELEPTQFTEAMPDEMRGEQAPAQAKYVTQIKPGEVSVYPFEAGTLKVAVFLKPKHGQAIGANPENPLEDANNFLPAFMVAQYASSLASGALARILMTKGQSFYDPNLAQKHEAIFDAACNAHFSTSIRGQQKAPMRVKPRWM